MDFLSITIATIIAIILAFFIKAIYGENDD